MCTCVCACVCVCEGEREGEGRGRAGIEREEYVGECAYVFSNLDKSQDYDFF